MTTRTTADPGKSRAIDISSASFGSDVSLGGVTFHKNFS
jgi:hypothetical protein